MTIFPCRGKFKFEEKNFLSLTFDTRNAAEEFADHFELSKDRMTASSLRYFRSLPRRQQAALERCGLIEPDIRPTAKKHTVGWLCSESAKEFDYLKPNTLKSHRQVRRHLMDGLGSETLLKRVAVNHCVSWTRRLLENRAESTVSTLTSIARSYFALAVDRGAIQKNPFDKSAKVVKLSAPTKDRDHFVTMEEFNRLTRCCHNTKFRNLLFLSRFCGVRVPSEVQQLRWSDIDYEARTIRITDVKRDRIRVCPLFKVVAENLTKTDDEFICHPNGNTYRMDQLFAEAGVSWPKKWMNMRASRETELNEMGFPIHVVAQWIGHSVRVAKESYLQLTNDHWAKAVA